LQQQAALSLSVRLLKGEPEIARSPVLLFSAERKNQKKAGSGFASSNRRKRYDRPYLAVLMWSELLWNREMKSAWLSRQGAPGREKKQALAAPFAPVQRGE
jgi:hypothetical protein